MIRRAKFLGVAPWELMEQPIYWCQWADIAEEAEAIAEQDAMKAASSS